MDENILEALYNSVLKFLEPLTAEKTYSTIVNEGMKLVGGNDGLILLEKNHRLEIVYTSNPKSIAPPRKNGFTYTAYRKRKAFTINSDDLREAHPEILKSGKNSALFVPLYYKNTSFGVLIIQSTKDNKNFTDKELNTLKLFGSLASLAIRKMQLYDETRKALDMRNHFISLAAHELRTPLTSIHGYLQLLQKKYKGKDNAEVTWIEEMYSESMKLMNLINELLETNHIETGKQLYHFSEVDVARIISKSINRLQNTYPKHNVVFTPTVSSAIVIGDEEKLQQVLFSLLDNAAKFSSVQSEIGVSLNKKADNIDITIKDQGRGIKRGDLPHIFEGFYKGANNTIVGMGLGLLLSKAIIKRHHGNIVIKSKEGKGTQAIISLPILKYE